MAISTTLSHARRTHLIRALFPFHERRSLLRCDQSLCVPLTGDGFSQRLSSVSTLPPRLHMSTAPSLRCRGLRRWCGRRCEASGVPSEAAALGFYCGLHSYQKPRVQGDGAIVFEPEYEEHVRRRTSFVAPELLAAQELVKVPGIVRDRPGAQASVLPSSIIDWLKGPRSLPEEAARAYAERMVALGLLVPIAGSAGGAPAAPGARFSASDRQLYKLVVPSGGQGGR